LPRTAWCRAGFRFAQGCPAFLAGEPRAGAKVVPGAYIRKLPNDLSQAWESYLRPLGFPALLPPFFPFFPPFLLMGYPKASARARNRSLAVFSANTTAMGPPPFPLPSFPPFSDLVLLIGVPFVGEFFTSNPTPEMGDTGTSQGARSGAYWPQFAGRRLAASITINKFFCRKRCTALALANRKCLRAQMVPQQNLVIHLCHHAFIQIPQILFGLPS